MTAAFPRAARLILACSLAAAGAMLAGAHTAIAQNQSYEVTIAGLRFDPKAVDNVIPNRLRMSASDLARLRGQTSHYLVQLHRAPDADARAQLALKLGLTLRQYVPNLSYVERLDPESASAAASDPRVRAIIPYQPAFKLSPTIGKFVPRSEDRKAVRGLLLRALLFADANAQAVAQAIAALGARDVKVLDNRQLKGGSVRVRFNLPSDEQLAAVARIDAVRWVEEIGEIIEDNTTAAGTLQSGTAATASVWERGLRGEGQIIGILDSPIDIDHCFFKDPADNTPRPTHRKIVQQRNASGTAPGRHGTFTAGNAAGDDFNVPGASAQRGGAWASRLAAGNNRDIRGGLTTLLEELNAAARAGAFIHTNSWHDNTAGAGMPATYNQNAADADAFMWNEEDHLVLGSVGNNGEEQGPPGTAKNAIGVAATRAGPNQGNLGDGNPGPTADGRRKPDLAVPGCGIQSAQVGTPCGLRSGPCATSYATPHAAAAAALVRQYFTEGWYPSGRRPDAWRVPFTPSGALIKAVLINSTLDMAGVVGYPSNAEGWGVVRLDSALYFAGSDRRLWVWDQRNRSGLATDDMRTHTFRVTSSAQPLKVVLAWSDAPATAGTAGGAVNNLDLSVVSPGETQTFLGNVFSAAGVSATGGTADAVNNVEVVLVNNPAVGLWRVDVRATMVGVGAQGYALAVTGALDDFSVAHPLLPSSPSIVGCPFGVEVVGTFLGQPLQRCRRIPDTSFLFAYERLRTPVAFDICSQIRCCRPVGLSCPTLDFRVESSGLFGVSLVDRSGAVIAEPVAEQDGFRLTFKPKRNQPAFLSIMPKIDAAREDAAIDVQVLRAKGAKR